MVVIMNQYDLRYPLKDNTVYNNAFYFWSIIILTAENVLNGESL